MRTMKYTFLFMAAALLVFAALPTAAFALGFPYWGQGGLVPCVAENCTICDFVSLVQRVTYFGITLVVFALAPIMIAWGGIILITGSTSLEDIGGASKQKVSRGKKIITSAVVGAVLALGAFVIVNTFYFVVGLGVGGAGTTWSTISCTAPPPPPPSAGAGVPSVGVPAGTLTDEEARSRLAAAGIKVESSGNCIVQSNKSCTSLAGIPKRAIGGVIDIRLNCGCEVIVTAGTEVGHEEHGTGQSVLDLGITSGLSSYVAQQTHVSSPLLNTWYTGADGNRYFYEGDHWHVRF